MLYVIEELQGYISQDQINLIIKIIIEQYNKYLRYTNSDTFKALFNDEYSPHNKQYSISWAISSAFTKESNVCDGFQIECLKYAKNFNRPLLKNEKINILILNKTTHFNANYLKDFYRMNSKNTEKVFCYFKFSVDKNRLTKVSLCYPDENGNIVSEETLLERKDIDLKLVS